MLDLPQRKKMPKVCLDCGCKYETFSCPRCLAEKTRENSRRFVAKDNKSVN